MMVLLFREGSNPERFIYNPDLTNIKITSTILSGLLMK